MDEDETVGWSNPSALAIEAHEDSIRQTLAERDAVIAEKEAEIARYKGIISELVDAMVRYEMDVDPDAHVPIAHRDMMHRARAALQERRT